MSDRPKSRQFRDLVADAVDSRKLGDDAREVSRLLGLQFRARLRDAESLGVAAGPPARRAAREAAERARPLRDRARPMLRRAGRAADRVRPAARQVEPLARSVVPAAQRLEPVLRGIGEASADELRAFADTATDELRAFADDPARELQELAESRLARGAAVGAAAGAIGAAVMGLAMLGARRAGVISRVPPEHITETATRKAAAKAQDQSAESDNGAAADAASSVRDAPAGAFKVPATILHVGFGTALGVGFGMVHAQLPAEWRAPLPTFGESLLFATAVWAVGYAGWIPALGLMSPPHEDEPGRPATMIVAHWIFGAVLGAGVAAGLGDAD